MSCRGLPALAMKTREVRTWQSADGNRLSAPPRVIWLVSGPTQHPRRGAVHGTVLTGWAAKDDSSSNRDIPSCQAGMDLNLESSVQDNLSARYFRITAPSRNTAEVGSLGPR